MWRDNGAGARPAGHDRAAHENAGHHNGAHDLAGRDHDWLDREAGPVVRPYAMTRGRVRPASDAFDLVAFVVGVPYDGPLPIHLQPEHRAILRMTREPLSVAEVSAYLDLPLGVVRVLLGDLLAEGLIAMHEPHLGDAELPDEHVLKAVVNGLRAL